jgi:hypothetical protein
MLNSLSQWFKSNGLSLNLRKTKVLKFDTINRDSMPVHLKFNLISFHFIYFKFMQIQIQLYIE